MKRRVVSCKSGFFLLGTGILTGMVIDYCVEELFPSPTTRVVVTQKVPTPKVADIHVLVAGSMGIFRCPTHYLSENTSLITVDRGEKLEGSTKKALGARGTKLTEAILQCSSVREVLLEDPFDFTVITERSSDWDQLQEKIPAIISNIIGHGYILYDDTPLIDPALPTVSQSRIRQIATYQKRPVYTGRFIVFIAHKYGYSAFSPRA